MVVFRGCRPIDLSPAQQPPANGILRPAELKKLIPQDYFFAGITASVQPDECGRSHHFTRTSGAEMGNLVEPVAP